MTSAAFAIITLLLALVVYGVFAALRRITRTGPRDEVSMADGGRIRRPYTTDDDTTAPAGIAADPVPSHTEAMILPLGAPMERSFATFEGPLSEARQRVLAMTPEQRVGVAIWTPGHVFTAEGLLAEAPGHEHDPLPPAASDPVARPATSV